MRIKNLKELEIINNEKINSKFLSVSFEKLLINNRIFNGDFYLDTFNYFPITKENNTFLDIFSWQDKSKYDHFFTKEFFTKFKMNKNNFKTFDNVIVLGSSPGDNYYRNLITFIPRLLFIPDKEINLVLHRRSSNKFRKFIENILKIRGIKLKKFIFVDNNFYNFTNSKIPQFFPKKIGIEILNKVFKKNNKLKNRIYITNKNANYRKIINESDLIEELKLKNFKVIDADTLSIDQQIEIFSSAEIIVSATCSALSNIVFCHEGTKIFEIIPKYQHKYEDDLKNRYLYISDILNFKYYSLEADPIKVNKHDKNTKEFIDINVINNSNYYKDLLIKKDSFKKFIEKI